MQTVSTIRMYLTDEVMIYVLGETSSMVLWSKLEKLYMVKSLINIFFLMEVVLPTANGQKTVRTGASQLLPKDSHRSFQYWKES